MANLKDIIYISNEDFETLVSTGTVTISGETLTYDANNLYITPDKLASVTENGLMSSSDKSKLDSITVSDLVHKTGAETISGAKTFTSPIYLTNSSHYIQKGSGNIVEIGVNGNVILTVGANSTALNSIFRATLDNSRDLGQSDIRWKNLFLSNNLSDGTKAITIAHIEDNQNKVTSFSSSSTDTQYPSALAVYTAINNEATTRSGADTTLQTNINTVDDKLNYNVHIEGSSDELTYSGDTVTKTSPYRNLKTGTTGSRTETIHLANTTTAGLMSYSDYNQIRSNTSRIEALEGQSKRLLYTASTSPTASDIGTFVDNYLIASGITPSPQEYVSIAVVVDQTYHIWHYYNNSIGWVDDGLDTVTQFTNSTQGVIQGKQADGFVYAESDGTGSVYGWSTLKTRVTNVENTLSTSLASVSYDTTNKKLTKTNNAGTSSDIVNLGLTTTTGSEAVTISSDSLNVVTRDTSQTITGTKTFSNNNLKVSSSHYIGGDSLAIDFNNWVKLQQNNLRPVTDNSVDLGSISSLRRWRNIYLSGSIRDGNNSSYGLTIPDTTSWTENKTISTTEYVDNKMINPSFTGTITVGSTTLTEAQLIKLIALLDGAEVEGA